MSNPRQVFLDRNILSLSIVIEPVVQTQTMMWGDTESTLDVHGYRRKPLKGDWTDGEVTCLPTIAALATSGLLKLFVATEVSFEGFKANSVGRGTKGDLFRNVDIGRCESPIDRSYFKSQTIDQLCDSDELIEFCETLMTIDAAILKNVPEFWGRFPEKVKENFSEIDRLKVVLNALPHKKHWPDAFHLWSAECFGADYFVTVDQKFINALTQTARIALPVSIVKPSELLEKLGVEKREPLPFEVGEFINMMVAH